MSQKVMERLTDLEPGVNSVLLSDLMVPLRYDIVIRADFFRLIDDNMEMASTELASFIELARDHPYHTWFRRIVPYRNHQLRHCAPAQLESAFAERVARSVAMSTNLHRTGLMLERHPVSLHAGVRVLPAETGKVVVRQLYAFDGCHRLALLVNTGAAQLRPEQYVTRRVPLLRPPDNTTALMWALRPSPETYYRYLSPGYTEAECTDRASLLESARTDDRGRLAELEQVLAFDEPALLARAS